MTLSVNRANGAAVAGPSSPSASGAGPVSEHTLLGPGSHGPEVKQLQEQLKAQGKYDGPISGTFDQKTMDAVKSYQAAKGLQVDGLVGQQTWGSFSGNSYPPGVKMLKDGGAGGWTRDLAALGGVSSFSPRGGTGTAGGGGEQMPANFPGMDAVPANGSTVQKMLASARSYLGYHEGAGNSNMFSRAMGRGPEAWCADFVSFISRQAGAHTVNTASAQGIADQLASQGRWKGRGNPQPGDAVTFNWSGSGGWADHVGMVESVYPQNGELYIRTIEGNSSDGVNSRTYRADDPRINGFGTIA